MEVAKERQGKHHGPTELHPHHPTSRTTQDSQISAWYSMVDELGGTGRLGGLSRPPNEAQTQRHPKLLIFGNTISGTPLLRGRRILPNPLTVAGITKKKIISMAWERGALCEPAPSLRILRVLSRRTAGSCEPPCCDVINPLTGVHPASKLLGLVTETGSSLSTWRCSATVVSLAFRSAGYPALTPTSHWVVKVGHHSPFPQSRVWSPTVLFKNRPTTEGSGTLTGGVVQRCAAVLLLASVALHQPLPTPDAVTTYSNVSREAGCVSGLWYTKPLTLPSVAETQ